MQTDIGTIRYNNQLRKLQATRNATTNESDIDQLNKAIAELEARWAKELARRERSLWDAAAPGSAPRVPDMSDEIPRLYHFMIGLGIDDARARKHATDITNKGMRLKDVELFLDYELKDIAGWSDDDVQKLNTWRENEGQKAQEAQKARGGGRRKYTLRRTKRGRTKRSSKKRVQKRSRKTRKRRY